MPDPSDLCLKVHLENLTARLRRVDRHNYYTNFSNIVKFTLVTKDFKTIFNPLNPPVLGEFKVGGHPQTPVIRLWRTAPLHSRLINHISNHYALMHEAESCPKAPFTISRWHYAILIAWDPPLAARFLL